MGEISVTKLLVVAALVVLLFGTKKLRSLGSDLGSAIKGFKKAMKEEQAESTDHGGSQTPAGGISHHKDQ